MAKQAWWSDEARSMIGAQCGTSTLATTVLGTTRARRFSFSGFVRPVNCFIRSLAVEASCISAALNGSRVVPFKESPRRAWLCSAPIKKVPSSAASAPRSNSLPCSAEPGAGRSGSLHSAPEPNKSINRTPNPLRGFGSLAALGAGYSRRYASEEGGND
jgi:hypothetical protein